MKINWKQEIEGQIKFFDLVYGINSFFIVFIGIALVTITGICLQLEGIANFNEGIMHFFVSGMTISTLSVGWIGFLKDYKNRNMEDRR